MILQSKIIAVDFDGTIVEDQYPKIGKAMPFAFETLKMLQKDGHRLVLWTVRNGNSLIEAVNYCKKNGIEFEGINELFPGENEKSKSRKLNADLFIDDRIAGGFPGWGEIYHKIKGENLPVKPKKNWLNRLLGA